MRRAGSRRRYGDGEGGQHTEGAIMGREDSSDAGILMTGWAGTDLELPGDKAERLRRERESDQRPEKPAR